MGIQINGQTDRISAVDGSFSIQDLAEVNVTGVATASNFKTGTSNVHSTGYECANINATGIVTAASANFTGNVSVGGTLTYQDVTNIDSVGIVTARAGVHVTSGNIGIGTDAPAVKLDIVDSGSPNIALRGSSYPSIRYSALDGTTDAEMYYGISGNDLVFNNVNAGPIALKTSNVERLRVTSDGKVAIGFNAPAVAGLSIANSSTSLGFEFDTASGFAGGPTIRGYHRPSTAYKSLGITGADIKFGINDVEKVRISSGGLAINKNSAADTELEIVQSADPTLRLYDTRNAAYKADFLMAGSAPLIRNNNTSASDRTFTVQKGTTDHLVIEGNGAVRKPLSPAFQANLTSASLNAATHNNVIIFNNEHFDNSNSYDTSNGRFTAPVAGKYYFGVQIYAGFALSGVRVLHAKFVKNGSDIASADMFGGATDHGGTSYHPTGCGHMLIDLAVNDWVAFNSGGFSGSGTGHATIYAASGTRFFGYLVG